MCAGVLSACLVTHRGHWILGTGVSDGCRTPCGWKERIWILCKSILCSSLLSSLSSPQTDTFLKNLDLIPKK